MEGVAEDDEGEGPRPVDGPRLGAVGIPETPFAGDAGGAPLRPQQLPSYPTRGREAAMTAALSATRKSASHILAWFYDHQ
ncbi:MAG: hypothetical protein ACK6EB_11075 [Planctomyces sp.]